MRRRLLLLLSGAGQLGTDTSSAVLGNSIAALLLLLLLSRHRSGRLSGTQMGAAASDCDEALELAGWTTGNEDNLGNTGRDGQSNGV